MKRGCCTDTMPVRWCERCSIPIATARCERCGGTGQRLAHDLTPVFTEELRLLQERLGLGWPTVPSDFLLWCSGTDYFRNGVKYATLRYQAPSSPTLQVHDTASERTGPNQPGGGRLLGRLLAGNRSHILSLEAEANEFVVQTAESYSGHVITVAFSGGKDSTVISHVVRRALGTASVLHVFSDTTIEAPDTIAYIRRFRRDNRHTPFVVLRPNADFYDLCSRIGPPSRILRWCCTSHKTAPMAALVSVLGRGNGVLTFDGIRASESVRRARYDRVTTDHKIENEVLASPIRDWRDFDVWLYILSSGLSFNPAYRKGFRRVGCLPCPFNSHWSDYLTQVWYPARGAHWRAFLRDYARAVNHPEPDRFAEGGWRTRAGGRGLKHELASVNKEACLREPATYSYTLATEWDDRFLEYLKPLGRLQVVYDDGVKLKIELVDVRDSACLAFLTVTRPRNAVRVSFLTDTNTRLAIQRFEKQIKRFQSCVLCGGCASHCPCGAICLNGSYRVDASICTGCKRCVRSRCVAAESLTLKGHG